MQHRNILVPSIPDAFELLFELRQREVAIIYQVTGFARYAHCLRFTVRALLKSQRSVFTAWQSQITEIDLIRFRNRPEVSRGCKAQS
jgi:hypothetical protein